ncbi:MAG TPA: acyl-CoA dehydratase activase [Phycisphaerae bacterium]|nr:acyl-CoA dehydratase activase [Phycisphaerae bacterium]HRY66712.1 acyl-CoA dehydratase activase [Phycisphaerae bacterium]HSA29836.1 acyl-CoA dehydratase activase [Phycisphaerae bacterium]
MRIHLGLDIGAVGIKAAILTDRTTANDILSPTGAADLLRSVKVPTGRNATVLVTRYRRTKGRPSEAVQTLLKDILEHLPADQIAGLMLTGSGSDLVAKAAAARHCNEFQAIARAVDLLHPEVRTVFEMGGETSKYLRLGPDPASGTLGIIDYSTNGDCAAGTGAFLDQQAGRLKFAVEDIGSIVAQAQRAAQIAGRCSVFAKSDMIHAQQKGFAPPEVLRGLCKAVAVNYKAAVVKGRAPETPVILIGGVSANSAVVNELRGVFDLDENTLTVPEAAESLGAIGAAVISVASDQADAQAVREQLARLTGDPRDAACDFATSPPLSLDRVRLLRNQVNPYQIPENGHPIDAYLGLDIGSVGTKLVVIDEQGDVVHSIFTRTDGRPIEVVTRHMRELEQAVGARVRILAVGTTGSGRELIGELVGADAITDEITCHKTGATFVGDRLLGKRPETIFEIGGQDSKFISLESEGDRSGDTIVVDFTMNEACAAGTGSFLEERAEELGVSIKGEFSAEAFKSKAPIKLGERCTVFMERDVNTCMQRGAKREDVIAGLAYSVVYNYINRVVRGRPIGDCVFFQGGTAYNDAVAAAFSAVTGKEIIVPPHNAVLGAIGAALLAREKIATTGQTTRFRGFRLDEVDYAIREFTCKGCGNHCSVQEFTVQGEKTFWGDKCSDRYRKRAKSDRKPIIADLVALRKELLAADDQGDPPGATATVGVPLAMYAYDLLPLYRRFFRDCGFRFVLSDETNRQTIRMGYDCVVAEPCFPIIVAHGHVADLVEKEVDYIWLPNILSAQTKFAARESHICPWGQTLPFIIRQAPAFKAWYGRILCPTVRMQHGPAEMHEQMVATAASLGVNRRVAEKAFSAGWAALETFRDKYLEAGREALDVLRDTGENGVVLVGRPYNLHDPGVTLATARKLRELYGVNLIPIDALPLDTDISDVNANMYWEYGRRILAAGKLIADYPNLHMIYITNFKCGPDSFVKTFVRPASGKPFLSLQFDGHSNDAGMMTRCEAYLDSKGILRWWRTCKTEIAATASLADDSTSHKWLTPAAGSWPPASDRSASTPSRHPIPTPKP